MARKKKHPEHVNHERWLVSYADFITLLFAFFVVMFAVSQVDNKKVGRFTESFSKAVGIDMFPQAGRGLLSGESQGSFADPEPANSSPLPEELVELRTALATPDPNATEGIQNVQVLQRRNELVLRLSDGFLFDSGNDLLEERARRVINKLAAELKNRPVEIRVEGHTDDRPIRTARFRSNWDLSTGRAIAVVIRLAAEGIAPSRLAAAGYGEFHPLASNATDEGRKQNRRVDLVVSVHSVATEIPVARAPAKSADAGAGDAAPAAVAGDDAGAPVEAANTAPGHDHDSHEDGAREKSAGKENAVSPNAGHESGGRKGAGHAGSPHSKEHP